MTSDDMQSAVVLLCTKGGPAIHPGGLTRSSPTPQAFHEKPRLQLFAKRSTLLTVCARSGNAGRARLSLSQAAMVDIRMTADGQRIFGGIRQTVNA